VFTNLVMAELAAEKQGWAAREEEENEETEEGEEWGRRKQ